MEIQFEELSAENIGRFERFYGLRPNKSADSVPLESFLWKDYYNARAAVLKKDGEELGLLWLYGTEDAPFAGMPLCRTEHLAECFEAICVYFHEVLKKPLVMKLADQEAVAALSLAPEQWSISEEEDFKDYLYDGEALRTLAGKKLHKKKNHCNSFMKMFEGRWEYRPLLPEDRKEVFCFLQRWREEKGAVEEQHLDPEVEGIHEILKCLEQLPSVRMGGIFIDGKLEAFSVGSLNAAEDMAVIHIEKADPEINGLYQMINREFLLHAFPTVRLVNREDDVGIEGLRKAKLSYYPCDFERKYLVRERE